MGKYINKTSNGGLSSSFESKCNGILADGGKEISTPPKFHPNLVCVVNNGMFGAAVYADTENEMNVFLRPDGRPKRWFIWDKAEMFAD